MILATNAYMPEHLNKAFDGRILPVLSNIVVTRPLSDEELSDLNWDNHSPICNARNLLFYYRLLPDRRLLLGARGDLTGKPSDAAKMKLWMEKRIREVFPGIRSFKAEYFWRGLVCITRKLTPSLGRLSEDKTVFYAYGYHANGVNTAPWSGRLLARLATGRANPEKDVPAVFSGQAPIIPVAQLRPFYLAAAYQAYKIQDFWEEHF